MNATQSVKTVKKMKISSPRTSSKRPSEEPVKLDSIMRLMTRETGKAIEFEISAEQGSKVYIAGTFNNWDPTSHPLTHHPEDGVFRATLHLPAGTHEYKFVVDGVWHLDAKCPKWIANEHGSLNSVIQV